MAHARNRATVQGRAHAESQIDLLLRFLSFPSCFQEKEKEREREHSNKELEGERRRRSFQEAEVVRNQ